jgi:hypothetical protein
MATLMAVAAADKRMIKREKEWPFCHTILRAMKEAIFKQTNFDQL